MLAEAAVVYLFKENKYPLVIKESWCVRIFMDKNIFEGTQWFCHVAKSLFFEYTTIIEKFTRELNNINNNTSNISKLDIQSIIIKINNIVSKKRDNSNRTPRNHFLMKNYFISNIYEENGICYINDSSKSLELSYNNEKNLTYLNIYFSKDLYDKNDAIKISNLYANLIVNNRDNITSYMNENYEDTFYINNNDCFQTQYVYKIDSEEYLFINK